MIFSKQNMKCRSARWNCRRGWFSVEIIYRINSYIYCLLKNNILSMETRGRRKKQGRKKKM